MDETRTYGINGFAWGAVVVLSHLGLWKVLNSLKEGRVTISINPKG